MAPVLTLYSDTNLPDVDEMRRKWCMGLPLTDNYGNELEDPDIQDSIDAAASEVERRLGVYLKPTVIECNGSERGLQEGVDFDKEEPPYDYDASQWADNGFLQLRERPVLEIHEFKLVLPNNQVVMDFLSVPEWVKLNKLNGQLRIVPYAGSASIFSLAGGSLSGYAFMTGSMNGYIPQAIYLSYTAGYAVGKVPKDIRNVVAKMTAISMLGIAGDALMGGVSNMSTSIDGLSESVGTTTSANSTMYSARINMYQKDVDDFFDPEKGGARSSERGITMIGL